MRSVCLFQGAVDLVLLEAMFSSAILSNESVGEWLAFHMKEKPTSSLLVVVWWWFGVGFGDGVFLSGGVVNL